MLERPDPETTPPAARPSGAYGPSNRTLLARRLRALRWGVLMAGAAATAAFSVLAMHQTQAQAEGSGPTVADTPAQQATTPSQSLFNSGGFSLAPGASSGTQSHAEHDDDSEGSSAFGGSSSSRSGSGFGGSYPSAPSASQGNSSTTPTPSTSSSSSSSSSSSAFGGSSSSQASSPSLGTRSRTRTRTS